MARLRELLNSIFTSRVVNFLLLAVALLLLAYTSSRAALLGMTHDESSTWLNFQHQIVWDSFFNTSYWHSANLHILNTLLMQWSEAIFGSGELALRLPNVLAHIVYILFSYRLISDLVRDKWILFVGFVLLNVNPYLLDFFSLARGYGLSIAFIMMSLYYVFRSLDSYKPGDIILAYFGAFLAVLANFTALQYFLVMGLSMFCVLSLPWINGIYGKDLTFFKRHFNVLCGFIFALLLGILLYMPVTYLQERGEFLWGVDDLYTTFRLLTQDTLYSQSYFGKPTVSVMLNFGLLLASASMLFGLYQGFRGRGEVVNRPYFLAAFLSVVLLISLVAQHYLLGSMYPVSRKALMLIPFGALLFFFPIAEIARTRGAFGIGLAVFFSFFMINHLGRSMNFKHSREWKYDAYTKDMVEYLDRITAGRDEVILGTHWLYSHTANFYMKTMPVPQVLEVPYSKDLAKDTPYEYYYVPAYEGHLLDPAYELEALFGNEHALFRLK